MLKALTVIQRDAYSWGVCDGGLRGLLGGQRGWAALGGGGWPWTIIPLACSGRMGTAIFKGRLDVFNEVKYKMPGTQ